MFHRTWPGFFGIFFLFAACGFVFAQRPDDTPQWLWFPEGEPLVSAPSATRFFRKTFSLPKSTDEARLELTADNHFRVWLNGQFVGQGDAWQQLYSFDVSRGLKPGTNLLAVEARNDGGA